MKEDESCVILCRKEHGKEEMAMFRQMIDEDYRVHWLLDNLPVAVANDELGYVTRGYPVGFKATSSSGHKEYHYLFNHVRILVRIYENPAEMNGAHIVGFEVVPFSIKHAQETSAAGSTGPFNKDEAVLSTCNQFNPAHNDPENFQSVDSPDEVQDIAMICNFY